MNEKELGEIEARAAAADPGPWRWTSAADAPQLEGSAEYAELNPVLVAHGCGNEHKTSAGVAGCMPEKLGDTLRACPLHPTKEDRDFIAAARTDIPALVAEVRRLRAWISLVLYPPNADGELDPKTYDALAAALRGDPAPEKKWSPRRASPEEYEGDDLGMFAEPKPPPHNHTRTSIAASESMRGRAPTDRSRVLEVIGRRGGATTDEVEALLDLRHQNASARVWELQGNGGHPPRIRDSGQRRRTRSGRRAIVWEIS